MLRCTLHRAIVASFERAGSSSGPTHDANAAAATTADADDGMQVDDGVYLFDVRATTTGGNTVVASLSDHHLAVYDAETLSAVRKFRAHTDLITSFDVSKSTPHVVYSGSEDRHVCCWDLRAAGDAPVLRARVAEEVGAVAVGVADSLLAVGVGASVLFFDVRSCNTTSSGGGGNGDTGKPKKLAQYADVHTDTVTQLAFSAAHGHVLASGAEDGLISLFDTSAAAGDDAVVSIFNTECPVRRLGFFGAQDEAMYCLSTVETASFWHCASAQRVGAFPAAREQVRHTRCCHCKWYASAAFLTPWPRLLCLRQLGADYLVDCFYDAASNALCLLAGAYGGHGTLAVVEPVALHVCGALRGGHGATVRCATYLPGAGGAGARLFTAGVFIRS